MAPRSEKSLYHGQPHEHELLRDEFFLGVQSISMNKKKNGGTRGVIRAMTAEVQGQRRGSLQKTDISRAEPSSGWTKLALEGKQDRDLLLDTRSRKGQVGIFHRG